MLQIRKNLEVLIILNIVSRHILHLQGWTENEKVGKGSEDEFLMIHLACLSFKQHVFLQASKMMKMLTAFDFHLSLGKNMGTAFRRSAEKHNYKLRFTVYFLKKLKIN